MDSKQTASNVVPSRAHGFKGTSSSKVAGAESSGRMKGVTVVKPIVYGNVAWYLGRKREEDGHTHQWTVYLRSYDNEDLSVYIKRVQFKLHDSYAEPIRVHTVPPYSITETGWGEFEIAIKIFFVDSNERPVTVYHFLKLFDREKDGNVKVCCGPVNSEFYDELVFMEPTLKMHRLLSHPRISTTGVTAHKTDYEEKKVQDLQNILAGKKKVKQEIVELKVRLAKVKENIVKLKAQVSK